MTCSIRDAHELDFHAIAVITNQAIEETTAHFGLTPVEPQDLQSEWQGGTGRYPWLVAVSGSDQVVGYAKAGPWKTRGAYHRTTEIGVYVHHDARGRGIGRSLYQSLFPALERRGFRTVLAGVALPNEASERLHESLGMRRVGVLPEVGHKFGRWIDVAYYARSFGTSSSTPCPDENVGTPSPHQ